MSLERRFVAVLGVWAALGIDGVGELGAFGQGAPPPSQFGPGPLGAGAPLVAGPGQAALVPQEITPLLNEMENRLRQLGQSIEANFGGTQRGRYLMQDVQELGQSVGEFRGTLAQNNDPYQARQAYSGIDASWHQIAAQVSRTGQDAPEVLRASERLAETDGRLHRALGLNDYPVPFYNGNQPLTGMAEVQRLARALVDRADALAATIRAEMGGPGLAGVVQDAVNLAQTADTYYDTLNLNGQVNATMANGFAGVAGLSDRVDGDFEQFPPTPRVKAAWQAYRSVEVLLRKELGLANPPEDLAGTIFAPVGTQEARPLISLADQLLKQVTDFLQVFGPTAQAVPEGAYFLSDAERLRDAATDFRQDAARNLNPGQLAFEFRDVDALWRRLARRTNRIARGRVGPNIAQVGLMGQTVAEMHRLLGLPGYPGMVATPVP